MSDDGKTGALGALFKGIAGLLGVAKDADVGDVHVSDTNLGGKRKKPLPIILTEDPAPVTVIGKVYKTTVAKVDTNLGLVFGYAIICKRDGADYFDLQEDHIPEEVMLKGAAEFMADSRMAKEMHAGDAVGSVVFAFPMTGEIAKALDIAPRDTGLLIAMKPEQSMLAKFASGELKGFSIGGGCMKKDAD